MNFKNWLKYNTEFKAFTLAEVLLTLMVIGLIAMVTLPSLSKAWEKQAIKTQLKQTYSELLQVNQLFIAQEGTNMYKYAISMDPINGKPNTVALVGQLRNYFKVISSQNKNYGMTLAKDNYKTLHGDAAYYVLFDDGYFKDNRGRDWFFEYTVPFVSVDVNGVEKGPNIWGYDIFSFDINKDGTISPRKVSVCSYSSTVVDNGARCAYYAINNISPSDSTKTYWGDFLQ